jgi:hypothetical protein
MLDSQNGSALFSVLLARLLQAVETIRPVAVPIR